jgi:hypothetical protein
VEPPEPDANVPVSKGASTVPIASSAQTKLSISRLYAPADAAAWRRAPATPAKD